MTVKELIRFYRGTRKVVIYLLIGEDFNDLRLETDVHQLLDADTHPVLKWVLDRDIEYFAIEWDDRHKYSYLEIYTVSTGI